MAIVDERGRLFGRLNLFDAIVAVLVLWMIPLAYGGFLLFRAKPPQLTAIEPTTLVYGRNMRIRVRGTNLAPYLRVSVGNYQGMTFKFNDTTDADVDLPDVPPGVYDVVLYDNVQERHRMPTALTIAPSALPDTKMVLVGTFGNLTVEQAAQIKPGLSIEGLGQVEQVGQPRPQRQRVFVRPVMVETPIADVQMVAATLRISCFVRSNQGQPECVGGGSSVQPTTLLFLSLPFGTTPFQIDQVRSVQPLEAVMVTVRFSGDPRVLAQLRVGDADFGDVRNELSSTARIESLGPAGAGWREARLTLQAQRGADGWLYANLPLRLGSTFTVRNARYEATGTVVAADGITGTP